MKSDLRRTLIALCFSLLSLFSFFNSRDAVAATTFGFNYWPPGYSSDCLYSNWPSLRPQVAADLDHMRSLGAHVLRLMIWPQSSGFVITQNAGGAFTQDYLTLKSNLVDLVGMAKERNMKVIIAFGNSYLTSGPSPGAFWWQLAYTGSNPDAFTKFLVDSVTWINGIVTSLQESTSSDAVLFYDFQNEVTSDSLNYQWWYVSFMYDWSVVPAGRRGVSILNAPQDAQTLANVLAQDPQPNLPPRSLQFVDFHSYPALSANANIELAYDAVKASFPTATVMIGEFGRSASATVDEPAQQTTILDILSRAQVKDIPYLLHWMLWDYAPPAPDQVAGMGYSSPHRPKSVMGGVSTTLNLVPNADMESAVGSPALQPSGWVSGGTVPITLVAGGPDRTDAATNNYYARVMTSSASGLVWLVSSSFPVIGGQPLYANAYVRSNMINIQIEIVQYDANYMRLADLTGPAFTPIGWSMNNYLQRVGSFRFGLDARARFASVVVSGYTVANPSYLDVDTVSASQ
jgi:hypothetical protein